MCVLLDVLFATERTYGCICQQTIAADYSICAFGNPDREDHRPSVRDILCHSGQCPGAGVRLGDGPHLVYDSCFCNCCGTLSLLISEVEEGMYIKGT